MVTADPKYFARLSGTADLLASVRPENRLAQLSKLIVNNGGTMDVPENPDAYRPSSFEATLLGVTVMDADPKRLPAIWIKNARRMCGAIA